MRIILASAKSHVNFRKEKWRFLEQHTTVDEHLSYLARNTLTPEYWSTRGLHPSGILSESDIAVFNQASGQWEKAQGREL